MYTPLLNILQNKKKKKKYPVSVICSFLLAIFVYGFTLFFPL